MPKILQLKISLRGSKPPVWRRILVRDAISFHELHEIIQRVMGWSGHHLFEFDIGGLSIGIPHPDYNHEVTDARKVRMSRIFREKGQRLDYMYDFGDSWEHVILVEKVLKDDASQKLPVCVAGKMACPPEDCGGIWGYEELLEKLKDKSHPEHKETVEWLGGDFDPEAFGMDEVNRVLQRRASNPTSHPTSHPTSRD
jgi:hypothetical protein